MQIICLYDEIDTIVAVPTSMSTGFQF